MMIREVQELPEDPDLERIQAALAHSRRFFVNGRYFLGAIGLLIIVMGVAGRIWWFAGLGLVFFGGLVALMMWTEKRYTKDNPVFRALVEQPGDIVKVSEVETSDSRGIFVTHWVHVFARGHKRPLRFRVPAHQVADFAYMLSQRCPNADVDVPEFQRRAPT